MSNINDFKIENGVLKEYIGNDTNVEIPTGIMVIGERAFSWNHSIESITVPNTVTKIDASAFLYCSSLQSISLPNNITEISPRSFEGCEKLKTIDIPDCVTKIGEYAFYNCQNLQLISLPDGITEISRGTFEGCKKLKTIDIPEGVTKIGRSAFEECANLASVTIPNSVTTIDYSAFLKCKKLKSINIPDSVTEIFDGAFYGCTALEDERGMIIIRDVLFSYPKDAETLVIPENVKRIESSAFEACKKLKAQVDNLVIPDNVKEIAPGAFEGFKKLADENGFVIVGNIIHSYFGNSPIVNIPVGVEEISFCVFEEKRKIRKINIPDTVKAIGGFAFCGCTKLQSINIPEGIKTIDARTFYNCTDLYDIRLPDSIAEIGNQAFEGCHRLTISSSENSYAQKYAEENGIPFKVVESDSDLSKSPKNTPHQNPVEMFHKNISDLEDLFKRHNYNNAPYPSDNDYFTTNIDENSDLDSVNKFFESVLDLMKKNRYSEFIMGRLSPEATIDMCKDEIKTIKKKGRSYHRSGGFANVAMSVCLGIAAYCFLSDKTSMTREFNRDKWESQGEYCSSTKVAYSVSPANKGGKAHYNMHDRFDG